MKITQGSITADKGEHVVITGPIKEPVTLESGEVVDVAPDAVVARDEAHAAEIAHAIGRYWADPNTRSHPEVDGDFDYDDAHHKSAKRAGKKG